MHWNTQCDVFNLIILLNCPMCRQLVINFRPKFSRKSNRDKIAISRIMERINFYNRIFIHIISFLKHPFVPINTRQ